eukprot:379377-Prymnesium_polylepis.5
MKPAVCWMGALPANGVRCSSELFLIATSAVLELERVNAKQPAVRVLLPSESARVGQQPTAGAFGPAFLQSKFFRS